MKARYLADTNILVYAHDRSEPEKQERAVVVLDRLAISGMGTLSPQVLSEFFWVATRRISAPLTVKKAREQVHLLVRSWPVVEITWLIVIEALRGVLEHGLAYWDAQIWATARMNQIPVVLSEDFEDGKTLEGIRFVNPLTPGFRLEALGI